MSLRSLFSEKRAQFARVYPDLKELLWPRRGVFAIGVVLTLVSRAAGLVLPWAIRPLIDNVIIGRQQGGLAPLVAIVLGASAAKAASDFATTRMVAVTASRVIADLRIRIYRHTCRLPVKYYDSTKVGVLVSRMMSDVDGLRSIVGGGLIGFVGSWVTAGLAFVMLIRLNALMTLLALSALPIVILFSVFSFRRMRPLFREQRQIAGDVRGRLTESFGGIRVVKGFNAEEQESRIFAADVERIYEQGLVSLRMRMKLGLMSSIVTSMVSVAIVIIGTWAVRSGRMTMGSLFSYGAYMAFLTAPIFQIFSVGEQIAEAISSLDRLRDLQREQREDEDPQRTVAIGRISGEVVFDNVCFEYEPQKPVLHTLSWKAAQGSITAFVGPSGAGKSTTIALILAFAKPTKGKITIDGMDLSTLTLDSYRSQLGVVFQEGFLFDGTIRENIAFGRPNASEEEILLAAQTAHVDEFATRLEKGYDTLVGERGTRLSGGQRQRIAIARAILASPRILILDEATSSLDVESELYVQEGLAALMKGRTTFVIAHRMSTIRMAAQIFVLDDGRLIESGPHEELLNKRGRYFELYYKQRGPEPNAFYGPAEFGVAKRASREV